MKFIRMGERLRALRKENHMTQQQVADRIGVSSSVLSTYEAEDRHPSYDVLLKLATLYNVSTDYLIGRESIRSLDVSDLDDHEVATIKEFIDIIRKNKKHL